MLLTWPSPAQGQRYSDVDAKEPSGAVFGSPRPEASAGQGHSLPGGPGLSLQRHVVWRKARTEAVAVAVVVCCVVVGSDIFCLVLLIEFIAVSASALCIKFCIHFN